jgi:hypothetical protein
LFKRVFRDSSWYSLPRLMKRAGREFKMIAAYCSSEAIARWWRVIVAFLFKFAKERSGTSDGTKLTSKSLEGVHLAMPENINKALVRNDFGGINTRQDKTREGKRESEEGGDARRSTYRNRKEFDEAVNDISPWANQFIQTAVAHYSPLWMKKFVNKRLQSQNLSLRVMMKEGGTSHILQDYEINFLNIKTLKYPSKGWLHLLNKSKNRWTCHCCHTNIHRLQLQIALSEKIQRSVAKITLKHIQMSEMKAPLQEQRSHIIISFVESDLNSLKLRIRH